MCRVVVKRVPDVHVRQNRDAIHTLSILGGRTCRSGLPGARGGEEGDMRIIASVMHAWR